MIKTPPYESLLKGGPFDGQTTYFNPLDWTPDERQYRKFYEEGSIEDKRIFSINFPEGARYRWDPEKGYWQYKGKLEEESQGERNSLFEAFGLKPAGPL